MECISQQLSQMINDCNITMNDLPFIKQQLRSILGNKKIESKSDCDIIICDDVRFENEAEWFKKNGILMNQKNLFHLLKIYLVKLRYLKNIVSRMD